MVTCDLSACPLSITENPLWDGGSCVTDAILSGRVFTLWQDALLISGLVIAVCGAVVSFFAATPLMCAGFAILGGAAGLGLYYLRQYRLQEGLEQTVHDLQTTNKNLQLTKVRFETLANSLQEENNRFQANNQILAEEVGELSIANEEFLATNQELLTTNDAFRLTNTELEAVNRNLSATKDSLAQEVARLTLQATQLRESSEAVKAEVIRFRSENGNLRANMGTMNASLDRLESSIDFSSELSEQVVGILELQQEGLGEQLSALAKFLQDLRTEGSNLEKLRELKLLNEQVLTATQQLSQLQGQYTSERKEFERIRQALDLIRDDLEQSNRDLIDNVSELGTERARLQKILGVLFPQEDKAAPASPPPSLTNSYFNCSFGGPPCDNLPPYPAALQPVYPTAAAVPEHK